jgi:hypothetical protein
MREDSACEQTVLARSSLGRVARCSCGHIHVGVGPVTLRLERPALRALAELIAEAEAALSAHEEERAPAFGDGAFPWFTRRTGSGSA